MVGLAPDILQTKLTPPPARTDRVLRPRLTHRLSASLECPLAVVCAPAGYGKTSLLGEWLASEAARTVPVAWLSLDDDDNDPTRFLTYLVSALTSTGVMDGNNLLPLMHSPQPPAAKVLLTAVLSRLESFPDRFALVLDDYHLITAQPIHDTMIFLLDHLPAQMRLVITSREDPPLPLARLRGRGQLAEIRADDLRFTPDEAGQFLEQMLGIQLSADQIRDLDTRTEGWIAGLQLAALAMKGREDVDSFISAFTGSHRFILDYLTDEVLSRQPEPIRNFLLQTSILNRLCSSLCDTVTGSADGQVVLEEIERSNLFLIALDNERCWYRYHHLFADMLRRRLEQSRPDVIPEIYRRASLWFEQHGWLGEAVEYALIGKDSQLAVWLVERYGQRLRRIGEVETVLRWLAALPEATWLSHPRLGLIYAFMLARNNAVAKAEHVISIVEQELLKEKQNPVEADWESLLGQAAAIRATLSLQAGHDGNLTIAVGNRALAQLHESDLYWRSWVILVIGIAYLESNGDITKAEGCLDEAVRLGEQIDDVFIQMIAFFHLARIYTTQGRLRQAEINCRTLLQFASKPEWKGQPATGYALLNRSWLLYERNELEGALEDAIESHRVMKDYGLKSMSLASDISVARVRNAQGNTAEASGLIQQAAELIRIYNMKLVFVDVLAWQAWLWLKQENLSAAAEWAQSVEPTLQDDLNPALEFEHMTLARVLMAQGRLDEAQALLARLFSAANKAGRMGRVIEISVLQALAASLQGKMDEALESLVYALTLGEPEGYVRAFVDEGAAMAALLHEAKARGIAVGYVTKLLAAFDTPAVSASPFKPLTVTEFEALSERELEVLRLVADGASNREVAEALIVSLGTVKKHLNNIFLKLDTHSRTQAVATARQQKLL